ncbi:MAG: hypothetical protein ABIQ02_04845 [Saprospiraceae bacterium]
MKTKIVMWGNDEKDQKVLIALSLRAEDNVVDLYTFPFESTSEEFYNLMLNEWRESHDIPFPSGFTHIERPLTASDHLLPDYLKVDRPDIIQRAQTEWHFLVLSNKLYHSFLSELEDIKEKIKGATSYKNQLWEEMKESWEKIQKNIFDKTLLRDHGQQLREMTNDIFTQLKNMRKDMDSEIDRVSHEVADKINVKLDEVEEKIKSGLGLQPLFNDLKKLQQEFKDADLSRNDRAKMWKRIDAAFKQVKEKKFGEKSSKDTSSLDRLNRRYEGLLSAIEKMDKSIKRDEKDKSFQDDRIANTEGQLEAQIRMAKLKMIDERVNSKNEKLAEMQKTKTELEERINREKKYMDEQKKQQSKKVELNEAKESVKQKIAETIHAQADQLDADALGKAADAIAEGKAARSKPKQKESVLDAISETLGESLTDLGDNISAIASVVSDKIDDAVKDMGAHAKEKIEEIKNNLSHMENNNKEEWDDVNDSAKDKAGADENAKKESIVESFADSVKSISHDLGEAASHLVDKLEGALKEIHVKEIAGDIKDNIKEKLDDIHVREFVDNIKEKLDDIHVKEIVDNIKEKASDLAEEAKDKLEDLKAKFSKSDEKADDTDSSTEV